MSSPEALVVFCTFPDESIARTVTTQLVEEHLVACAQRSTTPIRSIYRWQGSTHDDAETLVLLKTTRSRWDALVARLRSLHPYEVPQIVAVPALVSGDYGEWLAASTSSEPA